MRSRLRVPSSAAAVCPTGVSDKIRHRRSVSLVPNRDPTTLVELIDQPADRGFREAQLSGERLGSLGRRGEHCEGMRFGHGDAGTAWSVVGPVESL
jgi:hypothetical protein